MLPTYGGKSHTPFVNVEGPLSNVSRGPRGTPEKSLRKANEKTRRRRKEKERTEFGIRKGSREKVLGIPLKV